MFIIGQSKNLSTKDAGEYVRHNNLWHMATIAQNKGNYLKVK